MNLYPRLLLSSAFALSVTLAHAANTFPSSGNAGIGTTSPSTALEVVGTATTTGEVVNGTLVVNRNSYDGITAAGSSTNSIGIRMQNTASGAHNWNLFSSGGGPAAAGTFGVYDDTAGVTRLAVDSSGNVGIGTATPGAKLHIAGAGAALTIQPDTASAPALLLVGQNSQTYGAPVVYFLSAASSNYPTSGVGLGTLSFRNGGWGEGAFIQAVATETHTSSVAGSELRFSTTSNGTNSATQRLTITNGGNVGIGTTGPTAKLEVSGSFQLNGGLTNTSSRPSVASGTLSTGEIRGISSSGASSDDGFLRISAGGGSTASVKSYIDISGYSSSVPSMDNQIVFGTYGAERMRITNGGNVGIGTTNPTYKLSVNGTIRAKEVIVDTGWSDYVFDSSYKLAPLAEVKEHIRREGHLPGIPSAQEVAEHGVSMGEMQSKLLAKIEELTLHVIAQQEQLAAQAARIERLEAEKSQRSTP